MTTKTIYSRYKKSKLDLCDILVYFNSTINHCFQIEQLLKCHLYKDHIISKSEAIDGFGWTETLKNVDVKSLLTDIDKLTIDPKYTTELFKENFNLNYEENF